MRVLLIISGCLIVLAFGYFLSMPCDSLSKISFLKYLYNIKCKEVGLSPQNNKVGGTLPQPIEKPINEGEGQSNILPGEAKNLKFNLGLLYNKPIINYFIKENGEIILINDVGEIIKITGKQEEIIKENTEQPKQILFSGDGSKIVFVFNNLISIFDLDTKQWKQINDTNLGPAISPKNELAYSKKDGSIFKLDLTKENASPQKLIQLNNLDFYLLWKDADSLFIVSRPSSLSIGNVLLLNTKNKTLSLSYELLGLDFDWDAKFNSGLIFSAYNLGRGGLLFLIDKNLKLNQLSFLTIPRKCAFGEKTETNSTSSKTILVCAIPKNANYLKERLILDDWLSYDLYTEDDIYQIDLESGFIEQILTNQDGLDIDLIKIQKNKLFFVNRFDKKLYIINL